MGSKPSSLPIKVKPTHVYCIRGGRLEKTGGGRSLVGPAPVSPYRPGTNRLPVEESNLKLARRQAR
jgi:hypothetical protein